MWRGKGLCILQDSILTGSQSKNSSTDHGACVFLEWFYMACTKDFLLFFYSPSHMPTMVPLRMMPHRHAHRPM